MMLASDVILLIWYWKSFHLHFRRWICWWVVSCRLSFDMKFCVIINPSFEDFHLIIFRNVETRNELNHKNWIITIVWNELKNMNSMNQKSNENFYRLMRKRIFNFPLPWKHFKIRRNVSRLLCIIMSLFIRKNDKEFYLTQLELNKALSAL